MVTVWRAMLLCGLVLAAGGCQDRTTGSAPRAAAPAGPPQIVCPTEVSLGERNVGDHVDGTWVIENRGVGPLEIHGFRKTCNCGQVEVEVDGVFRPADKVEVLPGQARRVRMRLAVVGHVGGKGRQRLDFICNDPQQPRVSVEFVVERVLGIATASPDRWSFGKVLQGSHLSAVFEIVDPAELPRRATKIEGTHPALSFTREDLPAETKRIATGTPVMRLKVTVDTSKLGPLDGAVQVHMPDAGDRMLSIAVVGRIVPAVRALPGELFLPRRTSAGKLYTAEVQLETLEGQVDELVLKSAPPGVKVVLPELLKPPATLTLSLDPAKFPTQAAEAARTVRLAARVAGAWHELAIPLTHVP